jgi:hypothetical protein
MRGKPSRVEPCWRHLSSTSTSGTATCECKAARHDVRYRLRDSVHASINAQVVAAFVPCGGAGHRPVARLHAELDVAMPEQLASGARAAKHSGRSAATAPTTVGGLLFPTSLFYFPQGRAGRPLPSSSPASAGVEPGRGSLPCKAVVKFVS